LDTFTDKEDDAFHNEWIWLGNEKEADFTSYVSVDNKPATYSIYSSNELCKECVGGRSTKEEEEGDKHEPEPLPSFTMVHTAYGTLKSFFYAYGISEHNEQNISQLELALFCLKCKVSNSCQLQISLEKSNLYTGTKVTLYLVIYLFIYTFIHLS
jgi:hypothetical protein